MRRFLDLLISFWVLTLSAPLLIIIIILCYFDTGSPLFVQVRVGRNLQTFKLLKFRSMPKNTPELASHFINADTPTQLGRFLRRSKLDELPQLWNVINGEMSLIGPRPCLPSQHELINERKRHGVFKVRPGITGLAQINKIDMSSPTLLAQTDAQMINTMNIRAYFRYLLLTFIGRGSGDSLRDQ